MISVSSTWSRWTARLGGLEMVVMSILSDCQEMIARDAYKERTRQQLNVAKFILSEMINTKEQA